MRIVAIVIMALALLVGASAVQAQETRSSAQDAATSKDARGTVTGTVQSATSDGIVVKGKERDKEREWAFSVDGTTRIRRGSQPSSVADVKAGDLVTVNYAGRDGKIVALTVTVAEPRPTR